MRLQNHVFVQFNANNPTALAWNSTKPMGFDKVPCNARYIQILHSEEKCHWVCMASIDGSQNNLFDSLRTVSDISKKDKDNFLIPLPIDIQKQIVSYLSSPEDIHIHVSKVQQQIGGEDCGVFAIAFATHIAFGEDPTGVVFDGSKIMRNHLVQCLENGRMTQFPQTHKRLRGSTFCEKEKLTILRYCVCREIYDIQKNMVECSMCSKWYHILCVVKSQNKISKILKDKDFAWNCEQCTSNKKEYSS